MSSPTRGPNAAMPVFATSSTAFATSLPLPSTRRTATGQPCLCQNVAFTARPLRVAALRPRTLPGVLRARTHAAMSAADGAAPPPLAVMVNGLPGKMATATAEHVVSRGLVLAAECLTGPQQPPTLTVSSPAELSADAATTSVTLVPPSDHEACLCRMRAQYPRLIVVDYTNPSAANANVERYAAAGLSFVIGTTGGDEAAMHASVMAVQDVYAVIAPNMGKQIVAFQAMMSMMADQFPGAFSGYSMSVKESHQTTKADTSGTAKSVVKSFQSLGIDFQVDQIEKVRDAARSTSEMHVPESHVSGHAYHTYRLTSADGSVSFEFQHNVNGRSVYAGGTVDAVQFLDAQIRSASTTRIFSMIDILRGGGMS